MKRGELEGHLRQCGARFVRHGKRHDIWESAGGDKESQIPRHETVKRNLARKICDDLGVPRHGSL